MASAQASPDTSRVQPFKIAVPEGVLTDLKERLARTRFPDERTGSGWSEGANLAYMKSLVTYWRDRFDWRAQERRLNQFPQFKTTIDGITIHFIHVRSNERHALPLILTHGWPGSFVEFLDMIGPLTDPVRHGGKPEDAFDVVIPSLPGFGFSTRPVTAWTSGRDAELWSKLMARLGYSKYGAQGGDIGSAVSAQLAAIEPKRVVGLHLNMCLTGNGSTPPSGLADPMVGLSQAELDRTKANDRWMLEESAYMQVQGTKPQTLGYSLNDSPVGLAAWIIEKFRSWCDCNGDPETQFTRDELLTNITLYWITETGPSSTRFYYDSRHGVGGTRETASRIEVPTACAIFPKEILYSPRRWVETRYNVTRWTEMPAGGHFAALEQPALMVDDLRAFFRALR
jgi:pimeloyl-ACP methyl ester carboxylesterase